MTGRLSHARSRVGVVAAGSVAIAVAATLAGVLPLGSAAPGTAGARVSHCTYPQLKVTASSAGAAAGHEGVRLHFTNISGGRCSLHGYPGAAGLNKHGKQVEQAKRTKAGYLGGVASGRPIPTVVLDPHERATALVEGTDVPSGHEKKCRNLHGLLVTPPNVHKSVHVRLSPPDCSRIQVHPVVRNHTGSES